MIKQSNLPTEASMKDLLDLWRTDVMLALSCHHIGTVQSFNSVNQTASVTINYKKTYFKFNEAQKTYDTVLVDYPLLTDCPVVVLGGASAALTFPISQGDECLVLFNDRDMDNWFSSGGGQGVATPRLHSFSDAMVIIGVRSLQHSLSSYDTIRAVLRNGEAQVGVGPSKIKISNNSTSLKTLFDHLISDLNDFCSIASASGDDTLVLAVTALASSLGSLSSQVGDLLE